MKAKGFYTSLIALIALAAMSGVLFYARIPISESQTNASVKGMTEITAVWQNARQLYEKTSAEAMADYLAEEVKIRNDCSPPNAEAADVKIIAYLNNIRNYLDTETGFDCYLIGLPSINGWTLDFSPRLKCKRSDAFWIEKTIHIEKTASVQAGGGPNTCRVTIEDDQSGVEEIKDALVTY